MTLSDEFHALIARRKLMMVGDGTASSVPELAQTLTDLSSAATSRWEAMARPPIAAVWPDLPLNEVDDHVLAANMGATFDRLFALAEAYSTSGFAQHQNSALGNDIVQAVEYLTANVFTTSRPPAGNWWFWEIGVPRRAVDIAVLLADIMPSRVRASLMAAVRHFAPDPNRRGQGSGMAETGANRADKAISCALRGILDGCPDEIALARDALSDVANNGQNSLFSYVDSGDGFYADGSFVQHGCLPYAGTYGVVALASVAEMIGLLAESRWEITDPKRSIILESVENTFAPFMWNGRMMDTVRGRAVSRSDLPDYASGAAAISAFLLLAQSCSEPYRSQYRSLAKGWLLRGTEDPYGLPSQRLVDSMRIASLLRDESISPEPTPVRTRAFGDQDRLVHRRPSFSAVVSVSSTRIGRYEGGNRENNTGWYQGDGMTYVYTASAPDQYSSDFWPTVDPYRLPGTTVSAAPRDAEPVDGTFVPRAYRDFAGGLALEERWGIQGMDHLNHDKTLSGRKSWFFVDDRIVCLGSAITSTSDFDVYTTIDNRAFAPGSVPGIHIDGQEVPSILSGEPIQITRSVHIADHGGYVLLPGEIAGGQIDAQVISRNGAWSDINSGGYTGGDNEIRSRHYVTLTHRHGTRPSEDSYAYMMLPTAPLSATLAEVESPTVQVLANDATVQMIRIADSGLTLANFFEPGTAAGFETTGACSLGIREDATSTTVALSDPSRSQPIACVTISECAHSVVLEADDGVRVLATSPLTLEFSLDSHGHTKRIVLGASSAACD